MLFLRQRGYFDGMLGKTHKRVVLETKLYVVHLEHLYNMFSSFPRYPCYVKVL